MEKIDRLGWTAGLAFDSFGFRMGVRVNDAAVLERIERSLPPGWRVAPDTAVDRLYSVRVAPPELRRGLRHFHLVYAGSGRVARTHDLDDALRALSADIDAALAQWGPGYVFIHAGVVGWKGRAILLPGRSFSGKTTLVADLVRVGATYYSDDYAVLDAAGRVLPFARPLSVRGADPLAPTPTDPASLGGRTGSEPLRPALVVVTAFVAGEVWRPRPLSPGRTLLGLTDHAVAARWRPGDVLSFLGRIAPGLHGCAGPRGESAETARAILAYFDRHVPAVAG
jgi:hypothetical protein